jgi:hypothetical protein
MEDELGKSVSIALHNLTLPGPGGESREGGCVPSPWVQVQGKSAIQADGREGGGGGVKSSNTTSKRASPNFNIFAERD